MSCSLNTLIIVGHVPIRYTNKNAPILNTEIKIPSLYLLVFWQNNHCRYKFPGTRRWWIYLDSLPDGEAESAAEHLVRSHRILWTSLRAVEVGIQTRGVNLGSRIKVCKENDTAHCPPTNFSVVQTTPVFTRVNCIQHNYAYIMPPV